MTDTNEKIDASRRGFVKLTGLGAAGAVAATGLTAGVAQAEAEPADGAGYRETDHIRTYYNLARF